MHLPWEDVGASAWRTALLWVVALSVFRLMGKRTLGKMGAFDIAVIIMMGEAVAIGMEDSKIPLLVPIATVTVLGILQWVLTYLNIQFKALERLTQGTPTKLIDEGKVDQKAMRSERLSETDLQMELRQQGLDSTAQVKTAYLEPTGKVSVLKQSKKANS